ncbi:MAG: NAD(P)H-hydrate dehydratase [Syntrophomonadaceae bacterium]|jgi:NAD(P)H-hydrate epimerase|nr:NAD(P)H-hydrate dehydratase [Syntrophomonadaceae bacterium]
MRIPTVAQMQNIDKNASREYDIPGIILMENAGLKVVEVIKEILPALSNKRIVVLAGKGNNGGDGFVIARHLHNHGAKVVTFLLGDPESLPKDAKRNYTILNKIKAQIWLLSNEHNLDKLQLALLKADLVVDAIYGIGFKGAVREFEAKVIKAVNKSKIPVVAVDVPSGVETDSGSVIGEAIKATQTVTFALPKLGLLVEPGSEYAGRLTIADISIPTDLLVDENIKTNLLTEKLVQTFIKTRPREVYKGSFGHLLAIGGSMGMSGAITMTAQAALKIGAGVITAAVPEAVAGIVAGHSPEIMTLPLPQTSDAQISTAAVPQLINFLSKATVCTIGPGMGRYPEAYDIVSLILKESDLPVVIDADALNALKDDISMVTNRSAPVVLTPHPGEFSTLTGLSTTRIQSDRIGTAREFAQKWGVILVLKGNKTIIALPSGEAFMNLTGNPGMATAGSGDVLTGIIGGLIAQNLEVSSAALVGVYVHGAAGDLGVLSQGQRGLVAGDLIKYLPQVIKVFETELLE